MYKLATILLILLSFLADIIAQPKDGSEYPANSCINYIYINGETNVNSFKLTTDFPGNEEFSVTKYETLNKKRDHLIHIPVKEFKTKNHMMYNDFLELLKEDEHPEIIINISNKELSEMTSADKVLVTEINITLAGESNTYKIPCVVEYCMYDSYFLSGRQRIRLSDFNIKAPVKSLGLIKVKNEVIINFGFAFTVK
jgi:hypothetical protein